MSHEIDQSGKIEETNKLTVVAFANEKSMTGSVSISAIDKRFLLTIYRKMGKPKMFTLQVFSALVYFLIEKNNLATEPITIDIEYLGKESLIKSYILQLARKRKIIHATNLNIHFRNIGKKSGAHKTAIKSYRTKKTDIKVKAQEILSLVLLLGE